MASSADVLKEKKAALEENLRNRNTVLIAFSGGVDSALLGAIAKQALGNRASCVFLVSPVVSPHALDDAQNIADEIGMSCEFVPVPLLSCEEFVRNPEDRCYHCRKISAGVLREWAGRKGYASIVDGLNISDYHRYRPGIRASDEEGIGHPFVEAGIGKADIREIAKEAGYSFWDKPSDACLASRIPYGEQITKEKLSLIQEAEQVLKTRGFRIVRVRLHGGSLARIEIDPEEMARVMAERQELIDELHRIGLLYITLDLEGFRSGSMDEGRENVLRPPPRTP